MLEVINETHYHLFKDDPVRSHLSAEFRVTNGRTAYVLFDAHRQPQAVICTARTHSVPACEQDLELFADPQGPVAVFYTVWSYSRGAGRDIVFAAIESARQQGVKRFVTLSPLTEMAELFHTRNGATLLARHATAQNFEY